MKPAYPENELPEGLSLVGDRFGFALLVAAILHIALLLGVGFTPPDPQARARSLEITLATQPSTRAPDIARFLAQANQQASGDSDADQELVTPAPSLDNAPEVTPPQNAQPLTQPATSVASYALVAAAGSQTSSTRALQEQQSEAPVEPASDTSAEQRIASLVARLGSQQRAYASRPRVLQLTAVATRESAEARYLHNWKTRVEAVGNTHYPAQARQRRLFGDLRLLVAVREDGHVSDIEILQSSGEPVLDNAARRIVRLSAPFAPFPPEMRAKADVVEIIRTWRFQRGRLTATQ